MAGIWLAVEYFQKVAGIWSFVEFFQKVAGIRLAVEFFQSLQIVVEIEIEKSPPKGVQVFRLKCFFQWWYG